MKISYQHFRLEKEDYNILIGMGVKGSTPQSWTKRLKRNEVRDWQPSEKGGYTICFLDTENGQTFTGISNCSLRENYNKKVGRNIALGRAMKQMNGE
jgi:hypothetical protein